MSEKCPQQPPEGPAGPDSLSAIQPGRGVRRFAGAIESYVYRLKKRGASDSTCRQAWTALTRMLKAAGLDPETDLRKVQREHVELFRKAVLEGGYSPWSAMAWLYRVRLFFAEAVEAGWLLVSPAADLAIPAKPPVVAGRILSADEVRRWLDSVPVATPLGIRDRALLETLYATAMTRGELAALLVQDVDLGGKLVQVTGRALPLTESAAHWLGRYLTQVRGPLAPRTADLWVSGRGEPVTRQALQVAVKKRAKEAGIEGNVTPRMLRRCAVAHLLEAGANPGELQELLGHHLELRRYADVGVGALRDMVAQFHPRRGAP